VIVETTIRLSSSFELFEVDVLLDAVHVRRSSGKQPVSSHSTPMLEAAERRQQASSAATDRTWRVEVEQSSSSAMMMTARFA
jgi:hypothetical protein